MKIYLLKDANQNYCIGTTKQTILSEIRELNEESDNRWTLVDYHETNHRFLETLLLMLWRRFHTNNYILKLPIEEVIFFKSTCRKLERSV